MRLERMIRGKSPLLWVLVLTLGVLVVAVGPSYASSKQKTAKTPKGNPPATEAQPRLDPKAMEILKEACSRLAAAQTMTFTAVASYESPSRPGPPLVYTTKSEVTLQRPGKLKVITPGDGPASEFYYDGKVMMAYAPAENLVAISDAPGTIDELVAHADRLAAIYFPFEDVIVSDPYKGIESGLKLAFYIGQSKVVGGTTTDMVAIANNRAFAQVWIGAEDKLLRMIRVVYMEDPSRLRHQVEFSNWQLGAVVAPDAFTSSKAASATRIPFERPDPQLPPGAKPQVKGKPSKAK